MHIGLTKVSVYELQHKDRYWSLLIPKTNMHSKIPVFV